MEINPLEGLMLVTVNQEQNFRSTDKEQSQQPPAADCQAFLHGHRQSIHCKREPKKWVSLDCWLDIPNLSSI